MYHEQQDLVPVHYWHCVFSVCLLLLPYTPWASNDFLFTKTPKNKQLYGRNLIDNTGFVAITAHIDLFNSCLILYAKAPSNPYCYREFEFAKAN
jgi:hypothetical protein